MLNTEEGKAAINHVGSFRFLSLSPLDRSKLKELYNFSDEMLEYVKDKPAGSGIFYNCRNCIPFFMPKSAFADLDYNYLSQYRY